MKKITPLCWIGSFAAGIPLMLKFGYMYNAWRNSPMDRLDWVFMAIFLGLFAGIIALKGKAEPLFLKRICLACLIFLGGYIGSNFVVSIQAGAVIFGLFFWWSVIWLLLGWKMAYELLPAFAIGMLGVTSSTYWFCFIFGCNPQLIFKVKLALSLILIIWAVIEIHYNLIVMQGKVVYCIGMLAALCVLFIIEDTTHTYPPVLPEIKSVSNQFIGRELPEDESFVNFFKSSDAHHYQYADDLHSFSFLHVKCGKDIHEIHPASHCMRSAGWLIESEQHVTIELKGNFNVTEIHALSGNYSMLVWVWYSNERFSTGNFICFRRLWKPSEEWITCQLAVSYNGNLEESREAMRSLILSMLSK